jgi:hypothetical protein
MFTLSSKQFVHGLEVSYTSVCDWVKVGGMPVLRAKPFIFTKKSLQWVIDNKPEFSEKAKKMMEVEK